MKEAKKRNLLNMNSDPGLPRPFMCKHCGRIHRFVWDKTGFPYSYCDHADIHFKEPTIIKLLASEMAETAEANKEVA